MKPVLVTGAAGFIGSRVASLLLERGEHVVGIDNLDGAAAPALKTERLQDLLVRPGFHFHRVDIERFDEIEELFGRHRFRAVFHLAARAGVRQSLLDPWSYLRTNVDGTLNVLEAMRRTGVPKLVLASTSSLYAGQPAPFREDAPVDTPLSPYAASKKAAEMLAWTWHRQHGIDVSVLRYFTVFGPAGRPDMAPWLFIEAVRQGLPVTVHGDGLQSRDFTYVDDIARGTVLAEKPLGFEIVNLGGGGEPVPLAEFLGWIEEFTGRRAIVEHRPAHPADMRTTRADIAKARALLGWEPLVPVREGLRRAVDWHLRSESVFAAAS